MAWWFRRREELKKATTTEVEELTRRLERIQERQDAIRHEEERVRLIALDAQIAARRAQD